VTWPAGLLHNTIITPPDTGSGGACHHIANLRIANLRIANLRCGRHGTCPPADHRFVRPDTAL
jgi:hypothetical protein